MRIECTSEPSDIALASESVDALEIVGSDNDVVIRSVPSNLKRVTITGRVKSLTVAKQCFLQHAALETFTVGACETMTCEWSAFQSCKRLTSFRVYEAKQQIKMVDLACFDCTNLVDVELPPVCDATYLHEHAFHGCAFETIRLPMGALFLDNHVFKNNTRLKYLHFPGKVSFINQPQPSEPVETFDYVVPGTTDGCTALKYIFVREQPHYGLQLNLGKMNPRTVVYYLAPDQVSVEDLVHQLDHMVDNESKVAALTEQNATMLGHNSTLMAQVDILVEQVSRMSANVKYFVGAICVASLAAIVQLVL